MNLTETYLKARQFLFNRKAAYQRTFNKESADTLVVLADLAKFCRANESTAHANPHVAARLDGRREVWLRLQHHLQLTNEELWVLYNSARSQQKGE